MSYTRVAPLVPVSHQPDSSTFRCERGRELMTRRADTDMTCSRGKAGTAGYGAMACCFLQDYSSTYAKTIIRSAAISPYRLAASLFDASNFGFAFRIPAKPCFQSSARIGCSQNHLTTEGIFQTWCDPWGAGGLCNRRALREAVSRICPAARRSRRGCGPVDTSNEILHEIGLLCCGDRRPDRGLLTTAAT